MSNRRQWVRGPSHEKSTLELVARHESGLGCAVLAAYRNGNSHVLQTTQRR